MTRFCQAQRLPRAPSTKIMTMLTNGTSASSAMKVLLPMPQIQLRKNAPQFQRSSSGGISAGWSERLYGHHVPHRQILPTRDSSACASTTRKPVFTSLPGRTGGSEASISLFDRQPPEIRLHRAARRLQRRPDRPFRRDAVDSDGVRPEKPPARSATPTAAATSARQTRLRRRRSLFVDRASGLGAPAAGRFVRPLPSAAGASSPPAAPASDPGDRCRF